MLEKKIEELGQYFDGMFRVNEKQNAVRIIAPSTWKIYPKKTETYSITPFYDKENGTNNGKILFVGSENVSLSDIMDYVKEVMLNNIEIEAKKELFTKRIKELGELFDNNTLEYAKNIVFKYEKPKKIKKLKIEELNIEQTSSDNKEESINNE